MPLERMRKIVVLPALVGASSMGHESSGDGVSKLMFEFKVRSNAKFGAYWRRRFLSLCYLEQHRRASGCSVSQASGSSVAAPGGEVYDNWHNTSRR